VIGVTGSLDYGSVEIGKAAERSITITNTGTTNLTISGIAATGFAGVLTSSWSSGVIAPAGSQPVTLRFSPTEATTYSGTLTISGDQTSGTNTLAISGSGSLTPLTRIIGVAGSLNFGTVDVGNASELPFQISNTGTGALTVTAISVPNGYVLSWKEGSIPAGAAQTVIAHFNPTAGVPYNGTISVAGDQTDGVNTISISGTGRVPLSPLPTVIQFTLNPAEIQLGESARLIWQVTGATSLSINNGIGTVGASGSIMVAPTVQMTTYRLTTSNAGGTATRTAVLSVTNSMICSASEIAVPATAICADGSSSQSQTRQDACITHIAVRCWVCPGPLCNP
jgi:hypothetical protein